MPASWAAFHAIAFTLGLAYAWEARANSIQASRFPSAQEKPSDSVNSLRTLVLITNTFTGAKSENDVSVKKRENAQSAALWGRCAAWPNGAPGPQGFLRAKVRGARSRPGTWPAARLLNPQTRVAFRRPEHPIQQSSPKYRDAPAFAQLRHFWKSTKL